MPTPIQPLHPTLKACKCGFIGSRSALYRHLAQQAIMFAGDTPAERTAAWKQYFAGHGESVLNADDPRVALTPREQAASEAS